MAFRLSRLQAFSFDARRSGLELVTAQRQKIGQNAKIQSTLA